MGSVVPRPFEFREELWRQIEESRNGRAWYIATNLIAYDAKANLPRKAWGNLTMQGSVDREAIMACKSFEDNVVDQVKQGRGMYLYGGVGTGKTTWAYRFARSYLEQLAHGAFHSDKLPVYFVNVPSLLNELKLAFNDPSLMKQINHRMKTADLVIFDDIGAENGTSWANETLYQIINDRYSQGLSMVFTSNVPITQLEVRVADRIREVNTLITFKSGSRRK